MEAEERGQGEAIARNLYEMSGLKVPVLCIMIGEGGSGGALALSVGNEVWMLENATYSILSPEGFASILWKDGRRAKEASGVMKITAQDLKALGVIEEIIPEYGMADQPALISISRYMKRHIKHFEKTERKNRGSARCGALSEIPRVLKGRETRYEGKDRGHRKCSPRKCVTNDDLSQWMDTSDEWIRSRTGIETRHLAVRETTTEMAVEAAEAGTLHLHIWTRRSWI